MEAKHDWQWNEFQHVGADFSDLAEVEAYDRRMDEFRDIEEENRHALELLNLPAGARVLDIGAGTGRFARAAARAGLRPTAVDISPAMLDYARREAEREGLEEIGYVHAGFLTLDFPPGAFDAVHTSTALHHLPDLWKAVALGRIHRVLAPGGPFVLRDVVFDWGGEGHAAYFDETVASLPEGMRPDLERHIAREYSTLDWIQRGLLERAGFTVLRTGKPVPYYFVYHCRKA